MSRIFPMLASLSLGLFGAAVVLGLTIGDLYAVPPAEATIRWRGIHMLTGVSAALAVVFVHSIAITYFVGTSRWCKEVTETYRLDRNSLVRSTQLKRQTFPWSVIGMLTVVVVGALGAASDPGTGRPDTASWVSLHQLGALVGFALVGWTYFRAWLNIVANQAVIRKIVGEVGAIRRKRGLDAENSPERADMAAV